MKFELLKSSLKQEIKPAYFICGDDSFLEYKSLELIENACNLAFTDFNKVVFAVDGFSAREVVNACEVLPIGDEKRLVIVKDYLNKKNEEEKKIFVEYLKNPTPSTCLVFFSSNPTNDFYMSFVNFLEFVDCNKLGEDTLKKWVIAKLSKEGKKISNLALNKIIEFCNFSLTKIDAETNKLLAYIGEEETVKEEDVLQIVTKDAEYIIFELTEALSKKNGTVCFDIIDKLLKQNNNPTSLIAIITNHFRRMFFSSISTYSDAELSKLLNVKEYAIKKSKQQSGLFTKMKLKNIYDLCLQVDYNIKSGKMEGKNALSYLVANILNI